MYILAIDIGTSSTRAIIYSLSYQVVCMHQQTLNQYFPHPGWVEQDPEEIWQATLKAIREVVAKVPVKKIIACGITNQRETTIIWNKQTGVCLNNAISWQDRRTEDLCNTLSAHAKIITEKTGLILDAYFCASKLSWLFINIPEALQLATNNQLAFGTIDSFILWRLTNGKSHLTDITNASRTMLFNIHTQTFDDELLQLFKIPHSILPKVVDNDAHFGVFSNNIINHPVPITGMAGDQQAALIGQHCITKGMAKVTLGTGGFILTNTGQTAITSKHKLITTIAYRLLGKSTYGLEGSIYHAGTTIKWLRDKLHLFNEAKDSETLARSLDSNQGVYLIPAFTGLGAPHWYKKSGGSIIGLTQNTTSAHFARAALESIAYQIQDIISCMQEDLNILISVLKVDGGMALNQWLLEYIASLTNIVLERPQGIEATALGAAIIAAIGCGEISSLEDLANKPEEIFSVKPSLERTSVLNDYQGWLNALNKFLGLR